MAITITACLFAVAYFIGFPYLARLLAVTQSEAWLARAVYYAAITVITVLVFCIIKLIYGRAKKRRLRTIWFKRNTLARPICWSAALILMNAATAGIIVGIGGRLILLNGNLIVGACAAVSTGVCEALVLRALPADSVRLFVPSGGAINAAVIMPALISALMHFAIVVSSNGKYGYALTYAIAYGLLHLGLGLSMGALYLMDGNLLFLVLGHIVSDFIIGLVSTTYRNLAYFTLVMAAVTIIAGLVFMVDVRKRTLSMRQAGNEA